MRVPPDRAHLLPAGRPITAAGAACRLTESSGKTLDKRRFLVYPSIHTNLLGIQERGERCFAYLWKCPGNHRPHAPGGTGTPVRPARPEGARGGKAGEQESGRQRQGPRGRVHAGRRARQRAHCPRRDRYRADQREYRRRPGDGGGKHGLSAYPDHAGYHERGAEGAAARIRRPAGIDRRRARHGGRHRQGEGAGRVHSRKLPARTV